MAELKQPVRIALVGQVIAVKEVNKDDFKEGKFRHDCYIVNVAPADGTAIRDVYVTKDQWAKYGMGNVLFDGNIVNVSIDQCIAGETGYIDTDTEEYTLHEKSFDAFAGAFNCGTMNLLGVLARQGIPAELIGDFVKQIEANRRVMNTMAKPKKDKSLEERFAEESDASQNFVSDSAVEEDAVVEEDAAEKTEA